MPDLATYRRMLSASGTNIAQAVKSDSDMVMEVTWDSNIQSKKCYIYDYFHDDQKGLCRNMTYENTTKTAIDAKFIVTQYATISKDQVEYHIMFKPSQPVTFTENDELYYYEKDFTQKYGAEFPVGMYIDIPNEKGVYRKWLICSMEVEPNQFPKYSVLPCNYNLKWIEQSGHKRIKRSMWSVVRMQNSYNSGLWLDYVFESVENQDKVWLPMNSISENLFYTHLNGSGANQRIIVSAPMKQPITWQISKIENVHPLGLQKITLSQDRFNPHTDYVNLETGEMYADYYSVSTEIEEVEETPVITGSEIRGSISCNSNTIKVGGSYKLFTLNLYDKDGNDVSNNYVISPDNWRCSIDGEDITSTDLITIKETGKPNQIRIKFSNNKSYLSKILTVSCSISGNPYSIEMEIVSI